MMLAIDSENGGLLSTDTDTGSETEQDDTLGESRHDPMSIPQLDGDSDLTMVDALATSSNKTGKTSGKNDLYASRWADAEEAEASPPTPKRPRTPSSPSKDDSILPDSPASTDSQGQWLYPPRRIQYIASFIEPSATLTPEVRAAVWLWKAASKAQISWDQHMEKVRSEYPSMQERQQAKEEFQIEIDDYGEEEIRQYEELAGFTKRACYGNVLSEMLRRVGRH